MLAQQTWSNDSPAPISVAKVRVFADQTGASVTLLGVVTPMGVLKPVLDYSLEHLHDRSLAWHRRFLRVVSLFMRYLHANPVETGTYRLFRNFAQRLHTGTFDRQTGLDPSGLCWAPLSYREATNLQSLLRDFFIRLDEMRIGGHPILPRYTLTYFDRTIAEAAYQHARQSSMLGHTWRLHLVENQSDIRSAARYGGQREPASNKSEPPAFPESRFDDLIEDGFRVGKRYDFRGILITLLLHGAGFRPSEPFHLYTADVLPDPDDKESAIVLIHHPSLGAAPPDWLDSDGVQLKGHRRSYLHERWHILPRNEILGAKHAGWKGGMHEKKWGSYFFRAYWFEPKYGRDFLKFWLLYLRQVVHVERTNPFAFVNLRRSPTGAMYALEKFESAHKRAVERIGMQVAKELGTTPHGHRHAYGRRLKQAQIPKDLIRLFMHHRDEASQEVYTQPTALEMRTAITEGLENLAKRVLKVGG